MGAEETELEMVERHVREGVGIVARQRALVARLSASGLPTGEAERLLDNFEDVQRMHEDHLVRILAQPR
jgi:hypothetical protein